MKQWFPSPHDRDLLAAKHRPLSGKFGVWALLGALALMFAAVSLLVFTTPLSRNELGLLGGLKVDAPDDTTVMVGDRQVGSGTVDVAWNELLGASGRPPLAISIDSPLTDADLPAALGRPQAKIVWRNDGPTGTHRGKQDANFAFRQVVLADGDGQLDHVFLIECEFPNGLSPWQRLIVPVRTRKLAEGAADYFPQPGNQSGGNVTRGMIPSRRDHATFELKLSVTDGAVPAKLANQSSGGTYWVPTGE